ncbi:MAG: REP-associated tyrosine transposase [Acidobacteriota bacterium]
MARPPRLEVSGALYHVTARGNERRAIFRDDRDREEYLRRVSRYRERFRFQLLAYCLMTNHVHLAIRTGPEPLSRIIAGLHSTYAAWFNHRHARAGHLFQGRYKAFLVREDRYLHALIRYIHRNPVKAGAAPRPSDYPWSSDPYLRKGRGARWLDSDHLLALLDTSRRAAIRRYVELVDDPTEASPYEPGERPGGQELEHAVLPAARQDEISTADQPLQIDLDRLLDHVARESGFTIEDLRGRRCGGEVAAARCRAVYLARHLCRIPIRRLAIRLGRDDSSFARPLAKLESQLQVDERLRARLRRLIDTLPTNPRKSENQV